MNTERLIQQHAGIVKNYMMRTESKEGVDRQETQPEDRNPLWKEALVEPMLQSKLDVSPGDAILIRQNMESRGVVCQVSRRSSPDTDIGLDIIRLSSYAIQRMSLSSTKPDVLVERWDAIKATEISIEFFIDGWTFSQQIENTTTMKALEENLGQRIRNDLLGVPIQRNDLFEARIRSMAVDPFWVHYIVSSSIPNFSVVTAQSDTRIVVRSRASRLKATSI